MKIEVEESKKKNFTFAQIGYGQLFMIANNNDGGTLYLKVCDNTDDTKKAKCVELGSAIVKTCAYEAQVILYDGTLKVHAE